MELGNFIFFRRIIMDCYIIQHSSTSEKWEKHIDAYKNDYVTMQYEYDIQDNKKAEICGMCVATLYNDKN